MSCGNEDVEEDNIPNDAEDSVTIVVKDNPVQESGQQNHTEIGPDQDLLRVIAQKKMGCSTWAPTGLTGLKRGNVGSIDSATTKRICNHSSEISTKTIKDLNPSLSPDEVNDVLHDYKYAIRILKSRHVDSEDTQPSLEYMIGLINDWKPRREIICMYVRWSKRLRRNFHLDSISTLLCVAKQCDYKPYTFLNNIKTLTITRSTTTFGITFKFDTSRNNGIDGKKLNDKFLGLSITLRLLQRAVVPGCGSLGSIGLKTRRTKTEGKGGDSIFLTTRPGKKNEQLLVAEKPTSRFHTTGGLQGRIWLAIQHRWIALQIVKILFPTQLAHSISEDESLAYSFQMHSSSGPTRFDFLEPIIGVCMRYRSTTTIDNHLNILQEIWDKPATFVAFGNRLLQSAMETEKIQCIADTFNCLQSMVEKFKNITIHTKTEREAKWQMIRGYAFHFWLERDHNHALKMKVDSLCKTSSASNRKLVPSGTTWSNLQQRKKGSHLVNLVGITAQAPNEPFVQRNRNTKTRDHSFGAANNAGGLALLVQSRPLHAKTKSLNRELPESGQLTSTTASLNPPSLRSGMSEKPNVRKSISSSNAGVMMYKDPMLFQWASVRLATQYEITSRVTSRLLIHRDDGVTMVQDLSPLEVYSANLLYRLKHSRWTGKANDVLAKTIVGDVVLSIGSDVQQFIDRSSKLFHVVREESTYFKEHGDLFPSLMQVSQLCKAVFKYGKCDETRSPNQFRVNIGCGGQHKPNGRPETLIGLNFMNKLDTDPDFNSCELIGTIGLMTQFTWNVMKDMQNACSDSSLAPDLSRQRHYSSHLANYLQMDEEVGFEDVTVVVGVLHPVMPCVTEHVDSMNDSVAGYTRTGALNVVLVMEHEIDVVLLHVQVICNFRRVIREYLFPFQNLLSSIIVNCNNYLSRWQANINQIYGGRTQHLPSPFDRSNFFMDDSLSYTRLTVSGVSKAIHAISGEYLLTEISPSRVLSFSMFIDPIVDLREILCYDQQIELCFVASLLSNPFWFEHALSALAYKHLDNDDPFHFGLHPLYDWAKETMSVFGAWQGGPHNRWSPCGGNIPFPSLFGANVEASDHDRKIGCKRLEQVIHILYHHLEWVNSLKTQVRHVSRNLPLATMEKHMVTVAEAIYQIVPCQFNVFRLMVFTTISIGCGMVEEGVHLKAIVYPVKGSASFKHLTNIDRDQMTRAHALSLCGNQVQVQKDNDQEQTGIESQHHDQVMLYVSSELGMSEYLRDETECILCESHPNRNLQCRDWFKKGRRIYDLDMKGRILQREYGRDTTWIKMPVLTVKKFAYTKEMMELKQKDDATAYMKR